MRSSTAPNLAVREHGTAGPKDLAGLVARNTSVTASRRDRSDSPKCRPSPIRLPALGPAARGGHHSRRTSSCCSARPATCPGASCCPAWPTWRCRPWRRTSRWSARRWRTTTEDEFRAFAKQAVTEFSHHPLTPEQWDDVRPAAAPTCRSRPGRRRWPRRSGWPRRSWAARSRRLHYLSVPPEAALGGDPDAARGRAGRPVPGGDGEAVRHRPAERDHAERPGARDVPASARSSGSTTSWARRRRRTSWPSASPTGCSSRSGTATSSTTSRSTSPRRSGLDRRANFYESTGAYKDMVVTHLFQVLAFVAMEPPTALEPRAISEEKNKVFRSHAADRSARRRPRPVQRLPRARRGWPATPTPRPSSR